MKRLRAWAIRQYYKAKANLKLLGWFWGSLCIAISIAIFYAPSIYFLLLYLATGNGVYLASASGYVLWWFLPVFSPAILTIGVILIIVTSIAIHIKKILKKKEGKTT